MTAKAESFRAVSGKTAPSTPSPGTPGEGRGEGSVTNYEHFSNQEGTPTLTLPRNTGRGEESWKPLPWSLVGASLVAMLALFRTSEYSPVLPVMGLLLICSQFISWKIPPRRVLSWAIRAGVFTTVIAVMGLPQAQSFKLWYFDADYTNAIGGLLAAEMVIRIFETPPGPVPGMTLLLSGLIMVTAGNTREPRFMSILAPLYVVMVILALRSFGPRPTSPRHPALVILRIGAALLVLVVGTSIIRAIVGLDPELQRWVGDMIRQDPRASDIGLGVSPMLQAVFNPVPSMDRILLIDGPRQERYLRVMAFDHFSRNVWKPSFLEDHNNFHHVPAGDLHQNELGTLLHMELIGDTFDCLPLPLNSAGIISAASLMRNKQGTLQFYAPQSDGEYDVVIPRAENHQGPLCLSPDDTMRGRYLEISSDIDPKIIELAKRVVGDDELPLHRMIRLAQYLRSTHEYSMEFNPGKDPLADFILNNRAAHCEYFASALVIMARAVGVPARMVTGYFAHEFNGDNHMVVRDRDAHAWAECWIEGTGWMTFDATPSSGRPDARFAPPSKWRLAWESVLDFPGTVHQWLSGLSREQVLFVVFFCVGGVIVGQLVQSRRKRHGPMDRPYNQPDEELVRVAKRFEKWLKRSGMPCQANKTWRENATLNQSSACVQFLETYDEARFGGTSNERLSQLRELLNRLEHHSGGQHHG